MAGEYTVSLRDAQRILSKLGPGLYQAALAKLIRDATLLGQREARAGAWEFHDTGALTRSIMAETQPLLGRVFVAQQSGAARYGPVMESGRAAGARMPPPDALAGWMARHGIDPRFRYVVARAIARRGIKGRFFFRRATEALRRALPGLAAAAGRMIENQWGR